MRAELITLMALVDNQSNNEYPQPITLIESIAVHRLNGDGLGLYIYISCLA